MNFEMSHLFLFGLSGVHMNKIMLHFRHSHILTLLECRITHTYTYRAPIYSFQARLTICMDGEGGRNCNAASIAIASVPFGADRAANSTTLTTL